MASDWGEAEQRSHTAFPVHRLFLFALFSVFLVLSFSLYLRCERLTAYWGGSVAEVWAAGRGSTLEEHTAGQHWRGEGGGRGVGGRGWKD